MSTPTLAVALLAYSIGSGLAASLSPVAVPDRTPSMSTESTTRFGTIAADTARATSVDSAAAQRVASRTDRPTGGATGGEFGGEFGGEVGSEVGGRVGDATGTTTGVTTTANGAADDPDADARPERPALREVPVSAPRIEMRSTGDEPHRTLRIKPEVGARHRVDLTIENLRNHFGEAGTRTIERPLPFRTILLTEVTAVDEAGTATVDAVIESSVAQADRLHTADEIDSMRVAAEAMEGLRLQFLVSSTGRIERLLMEPIRTEDPEHTEAAERQATRVVMALTRLVMALPDEAVGENARWRTTIFETVDGVERTNIGEFTLEKSDGDDIVVRRDTRIIGVQQPGDPELIPGAPNVELSHHSGFGKGEIVRTLSFVFPDRVADEFISTSMHTARIAGERIIKQVQTFVRIRAESRAIGDDAPPRRRVGD